MIDSAWRAPDTRESVRPKGSLKIARQEDRPSERHHFALVPRFSALPIGRGVASREQNARGPRRARAVVQTGPDSLTQVTMRAQYVNRTTTAAGCSAMRASR